MTVFEDRGLSWRTTPQAADSDALPAPRGIAVRISGLVGALLRWLGARHERRAARWQLQAVNDWQLKDIGISRCEIDYWTRSSRAQARRSSHAEH